MKNIYKRKTFFTSGLGVIILCFIISFSFAPIGSLAKSISLIAKNYASSYSSVTFAGSCYIKNASELQNINSFMQSNSGYYRYYLLDNINVYNYTPIGNDSFKFKGEFYGNGFTITINSFNATGKEYLGVFGLVGENSKIENLNVIIKTPTISASSAHYFGGIAGSAKGGTVIKNCNNLSKLISIPNIVTGGQTNTPLTIGLNDSNDAYVGGIVGNTSGEVLNCISYAPLNITAASYIGGIVGNASQPVKKSINYGAISSSATSGDLRGFYIGGVCGYTTNTLTDCYNFGALSTTRGVGVCIGGISGYSNEIYSCYNVGNITTINTSGNHRVGGIAGRTNKLSKASNQGAVSVNCTACSNHYIGGIVGYMGGDGNCSVNTGKVSMTRCADPSKYFVGGIFGYTNGTSYFYLYNDAEVNVGITSGSNLNPWQNVGTIVGKSNKSAEDVGFIDCVSLHENIFNLSIERFLNGYLASGWIDEPSGVPKDSGLYENKTTTLNEKVSMNMVGNFKGEFGSGNAEVNTTYDGRLDIEFNIRRFWEKGGVVSKEEWNRSLFFRIENEVFYLMERRNYLDSSDPNNYEWFLYHEIYDFSSNTDDGYGIYDLCDIDTTEPESFIYGGKAGKNITANNRFLSAEDSNGKKYDQNSGFYYYIFAGLVEGLCAFSDYETEYFSEGIKQGDEYGDPYVGENDKGDLIDLISSGIGPICVYYDKSENAISLRFNFVVGIFFGSDSNGDPTGGGGFVDQRNYYYYEIAYIDLDDFEDRSVMSTSSYYADVKLNNFLNNQGWIDYKNGYIKLNAH